MRKIFFINFFNIFFLSNYIKITYFFKYNIDIFFLTNKPKVKFFELKKIFEV